MGENVKDVSNFYKMEQEQSTVFPNLTLLQEYIIVEMSKGKSVTSIAKDLHVHVVTVQRRMKSVAFVRALKGVNDAKHYLSVQAVKDRLMQIVMLSKNENAIIKASHELLSAYSNITLAELGEQHDRHYDAILAGHIHHFTMQEVGNNRYQATFGSIKGMDDYSIKLGSKACRSQGFVLVNNDGFDIRKVNL